LLIKRDKNMSENHAAENLVGLTLETGWEIIEKIQREGRREDMNHPDFSIFYKARKGDEHGFVKAYNFEAYLKLPAASIMDNVSYMSSAFIYERDLSELCKNKHVTKIVVVKDSGIQRVPDFPETDVVPYLVFDLADGDVRSKLEFTGRLETAWKLKSLHDVAVGLKQLHTIEISHQDIKPSKVLLFHDESKLGNLEKSSSSLVDSPRREMVYNGDIAYAPPEILYHFSKSDWKERTYATDCYLFGSLIVFFFSGISMTALLKKHIPKGLSWDSYFGPFNEVETYVIDAFSNALMDFNRTITIEFLKEELCNMVKFLCYPLPEKRGHPKLIDSTINANQYNMERFISRLELLHRKVKFTLLR